MLWDETVFNFTYYMVGLVSSLAIWVKILSDHNRNNDNQMLPNMPAPPEAVMLGIAVNMVAWPIMLPLFLAAMLTRKK